MHSIFKTLRDRTVIFILLSLVIGCSPEQQQTQRSIQQTPTSAEIENLPKTVDAKASKITRSNYSLGEAIAIKQDNTQVQMIVNKIWEHQGKGIIEPNPGQKWIAVDTTLTNQGKEPQTFSIVSFVLEDNQKNQYEVALIANALDDVEPPTGTIPPGEQLQGEVVFEVPQNAAGLQLIFQPDLACEPLNEEQKATQPENCQQIAVKLD